MAQASVLCPKLRMLGAGGLGLTDSDMLALATSHGQTLEHLGIG